MRKYLYCSVFSLFMCSSAVANGNLHTLIVELENLKGLVAQQERKAVDSEGRWVFRYDILRDRLDALIIDINRHIDVVNQTPKLERF